MPIAKFPFVKIGKGPLGEIYRPYAAVFLFSEKRKEWLLSRMVVDSGADYTLLPRHYAIALGRVVFENFVTILEKPKS